MSWQDEIELIMISEDGDETSRAILANKLPIRRSEFYQAAAAGLVPDIGFEVWTFEHEGEILFRHEGTLYHILRSYDKPNDNRELFAGALHFHQTVTLVRKHPDPESMNIYGVRPTIGESTISCRMDETSKVVRDREGAEVVSVTQFTFPGWIKIAYHDEMKWRDGSGQSMRRSPIAMERVRDRNGMIQFLVVSC